MMRSETTLQNTEVDQFHLMAKSKKNFSHRVIFTDQHKVVVTTPKGWAREHKAPFPNYTFVGRDVPKTKEIEEHLSSMGFKYEANTEMMIYYDFRK
jgi:hypothetical protein